MTSDTLLTLRLLHQQIAVPDKGALRATTPAALVAYFGATQAQEYGQTKWSLGLRLPGSREAEVEEAFSRGAIVRTHILRPTWHFVAAEDLRWMLSLSAPRVHGANAYYYKKCGLDAAAFRRCHAVLENELTGGRFVDRDTLKAALAKAGLEADGLRMAYLLMEAELEGVICSGPRQGKQFTYALMDERVPPAPALSREAARARLSERYFASRGPATAEDFAWWSGLTLQDARAALADLPKTFERASFEGREHAFLPLKTDPLSLRQSTFLMSEYDEYGIAYKDRSVLSNPERPATVNREGQPVRYYLVVLGGRVGGLWRPVVKGRSRTVEIIPYGARDEAEEEAIKAATARYLDFWAA